MKYIEIKNSIITIKEKNIRDINKWEVLIKMKYAWLCWSDLHKINDENFIQQNILWHEIVWEIIQSKNFNDIWKTVAVNPIITCWKCDYCKHTSSQFCERIHSLWKDLDWWFSEFIIAPQKNIYFLKSDFESKLWILLDWEAVILHALKLMKKKFNKGTHLKIAIIWSWSIALLLGITLKILSIHQITIICKKEKESYFTMQWFQCLDFFNKEDMSDYFDVVFECVWGSQPDTINFAINSTKKKWMIIWLWVFKENYLADLNIRKLLYKEITLQWSNSFNCNSNSNDFLEGYNIIKKNQDRFIKVLWNSYNIKNFNEWISNKNNYLKTFFYFD